MDLEKRKAGEPLSEAEHQQRVDAARARWTNAVALVAAGGGAAAAGRAVARTLRQRTKGHADTVYHAGQAQEAVERLNAARTARHTAAVEALRGRLAPSGTRRFLDQAGRTLASQRNRAGAELRQHFDRTKERLLMGDGSEVFGSFDVDGMSQRRAVLEGADATLADLRANGRPSERRTIEVEEAAPARAHTRRVRGAQQPKWAPGAEEQFAYLRRSLGLDAPVAPTPPRGRAAGHTNPTAPAPSAASARTGLDGMEQSNFAERTHAERQVDAVMSAMTAEERIASQHLSYNKLRQRIADRLGVKLPSRRGRGAAPGKQATANAISRHKELVDTVMEAGEDLAIHHDHVRPAELRTTLRRMRSLDDVARVVRGMRASDRNGWLDANLLPRLTWERPEVDVQVREGAARPATTQRRTFDGYPNQKARSALAERLQADVADRAAAWAPREAAAARWRTVKARMAFRAATHGSTAALDVLRDVRVRRGAIGAGALLAGLGTFAAVRGAGAFLLPRSDTTLGKAFRESTVRRDAAGRFSSTGIGAMPAPGDRPRVTLLIGLPGSGKSTWRAMQFAQTVHRPTTVISTDDHVDDIARQHGLTYSEAFKRIDVDALEHGQRQVMTDAIAAGRDVIVDRTNLSPKSRARTMKGIPAHYERHAVVFDVPEAELVQRRSMRPGKVIPARTLAEMQAAMQAPAPGEFDRVHQVGPAPLAKAAGKGRKSRAAAVDQAEGAIAERLAGAFGALKDTAAERLAAPAGDSLHDTMLDLFDHALKPLDAAGAAGAGEPIPVSAGGERPKTIAFSMAARSPFVTGYVADYRKSRVVELADEQRDAIKGQLLQAAMEGASPQKMAQRIKETVGLAASQMQHVRNYRDELEQLDPNALKRELRDRRYDGPIARAMESGEVLGADQVDRYVDAYHRRYLAYRATTIARTEGVGAANNGQLAAARAALEQQPGYTAVKTWIATDDERTRHDHRELNGQEVEGLDTPFICSSGDTIRWPHDPEAPARQTIHCRCTVGIRLVRVADSPADSP